MKSQTLYTVVFALLLMLISPLSFAVGQELTDAPNDTISSKANKKDQKPKPLPLKTDRTLAFTAEEGTWISLDVSPDGQTIVFDLLGDLYTMPISGGKAASLTSGMGYDVQPRFSPDGKRVAFVSDSSGSNNVWLVDIESKELEALTKATVGGFVSPEWTPDGKYIIVSKSDATFRFAKLSMIHVDGGSGVNLIKAPEDLKTIGAAFGSDERYIWYAQRNRDWEYNAIFPQYQLSRYDRDSGKSTVMTSRYGSAIRPALSPDGKYLAYATRYDHQTGMRIRELNSGEERWLAYPVQRDDQEARATSDAFPGYSFTPDSRSIIVSYGGKIWQVPVDGGAAQQIPFTADVNLAIGPEVKFDYEIDDNKEFVARQIRHTAPSPDGKKIAFTSLDRLYIANIDGSEPARLTKEDTGEHYPAWSPDGKWIAYVTWDDDGGGHITKMRADGKGKPVQLTKISAMYSQTAWSPDGRRIVAVRASARDLRESTGFFIGGLATQLVFVNAAGGNGATVIAPTEGKSNPHFVTGDANRMYVSGPQGSLMSLRWDGTDEKTHVKVAGRTLPGAKEPLPAAYVIMAPKGDQAIAQVINDLYVVTVPYVGGETPVVNIASPEAAAFPARKLTEIGGQFPKWHADGRTIHWSIGNAFVTYNLDDAKAFEDSLEAAKKLEAEMAKTDSADVAEEDSTAAEDKPEKYMPQELRITIMAQRDLPEGVVVLSGARVITMNGDEIIDNADIVVRNNRIADVGAKGSVTVPDGAETIDVSGKTIIPGFVDTHYHAQWLIPEIHNSQVWQYLTNLAYGVTTTRDPQTATTDILSYSDLVETGDMIGPRIYSTGPGVFSWEGFMDFDHARNVLKRYSEYYDTKTFKMYMSGNRQQRQWLIMAAKEQELMPTTEGGLDYKLNITHAIDGYSGLEHSLPIYPIYSDIIKLFALTGIVNSPTLLVSYGGPFAENYFYTRENVYNDAKLRYFTPYKELAEKTLRRGGNPGRGGWFHEDEHVFQKHAEFIRDLIAAGGKAAVGSHGQLQGLGYHWELWAMQAGGLSEHDALRAATIFGAEAIGFGNDIGTIEAGKLADLIILEKDPLENIRNTNTVTHVMKNGRLYDGDTLDEVWPQKKALAVPYWKDSAPDIEAGIQ